MPLQWLNYVNDLKATDRNSSVLLPSFVFLFGGYTAFIWLVVPKAEYGSECFEVANFGLFKCNLKELPIRESASLFYFCGCLISGSKKVVDAGQQRLLFSSTHI